MRPTLFVIIATLLLSAGLASAQSLERTVRVWAYPNAPQIFIDDTGKARGIYADLLREVATLEGWQLEFVTGTFAEGLDATRDGRVDIMTSIANTRERAEFLDFSKETIVSVWGQLYVQPAFDPVNIFDLHGKTIAVMDRGALGKSFEDLCQGFSVDCRIVPAKSYETALQMVHDKKADGAVVNSILGFLRDRDYDVERSSLVFSPFRVNVAVPKGQNADLIAAIDRHIAAWRADKSSVYYQALDRWLGLKQEDEPFILPNWLFWALVTTGFVGALVLLWNWTLRHEIRRRKTIEAKLARQAEELHWNERRLNLLLELSKAAPKLNEKQILERALDIAVEVTHSQVGYLHLVNEDQETLTLSTWNAETLKQCTAAHDDHYPVSDAGIWADSIRNMKPVIHNDYQAEPDKRGYPEGHFHITRHMSAPVTDGNRVSLVIGVGNKATDYDLADELQLQSVANDIEKMVMRRRTDEQLNEAKIEAEIANEAKSRFLASMSHDLRTPLNAIMGFSDMMRYKAFGPLGDPKYEQYANDIYDSGTLLVSLINDVLDLSKIEAGKYELVEEELEVLPLVQMSCRQLEKMAETAGQTLDCSATPNDLNFKGDERALIQIFNNLISNAIKFTPAGGDVRISAGLDEQDALIVEVSDTGIGMSEDGIAKALQPFEQADGTHSRRHEGTGLGLHLCVNFMKLFGGTLDIESEVGKGTTVVLRFPPDRTLKS